MTFGAMTLKPLAASQTLTLTTLAAAGNDQPLVWLRNHRAIAARQNASAPILVLGTIER